MVERALRRTRVSLPRIPRGSRNPPGWGNTDIRITTRGMPGLENFRFREPAGDPPPEFPGTRPEWAVFWAMTQLGYTEGIDFFFEANVMGVWVGYYSELDFYIPSLDIGIEIQGEHWHYHQGTDKMQQDILRAVWFASHGITVIFIDEDDALEDPIWYTQEALQGRDHSKLARQFT